MLISAGYAGERGVEAARDLGLGVFQTSGL